LREVLILREVLDLGFLREVFWDGGNRVNNMGNRKVKIKLEKW
jgi:hypothetical protein